MKLIIDTNNEIVDFKSSRLDTKKDLDFLINSLDDIIASELRRFNPPIGTLTSKLIPYDK